MQNLINTIINSRHFWRNIKISELSELYISMTLKSLALSLVAIFIPVYLYELGFSVLHILLYFASYFVMRTVLDLVAGFLTARFGPRHILSYSYVVLLVFLGLLITMPVYDWPLELLAFAQAMFNSLFFVSYHVDFSKIHSVEKGGSELSWMNILVRLAATAGPFIGGLLATVYSISASLALAIFLVMFAILPLMSAETVKRRQPLDLKQFQVRKNIRTIISYAGMTISRQVSLIIWPLYIAVFIFTDDIYAKVGLVTSVSIAVSLIVARLYGKLIDKRSGGKLLNASSWLGALVNVARPGIQSLSGVALINTTSELADTGIILSITKGFYDEADDSGNRIAYIAMIESIVALLRAVFFIGLAVIALNFSEQTALIASFYVASVFILLTTIQRFKALSPETGL